MHCCGQSHSYYFYGYNSMRNPWASLTLVMMSSRVALDTFEFPKDLMLNAPIRNELPMWTETRSKPRLIIIFMLQRDRKHIQTCIRW